MSEQERDTTTGTTTRCVRCGRLAPDQELDAFTEWEVLVSETEVQLLAMDVMTDAERMVCPGCLTGAEEQQMAEQFSGVSE